MLATIKTKDARDLLVKTKTPKAQGLFLRYTWKPTLLRQSGPNLQRIALIKGEEVFKPVPTWQIGPRTWLTASHGSNLPLLMEGAHRWRIECATLADMARLAVNHRVIQSDDSISWPGETPAPQGGRALYVRIYS